MRRVGTLTLPAVVLGLASLWVWPISEARGESASDVTVEITRLRARLADNSAQEQHCLAGATRPVWTASLAGDVRALRERAREEAASGDAAQARRWRELLQKAEALETRATESARTGADLFQSQQIGLDCLERFAAEREALRASLEVALIDPTAYGESLRLAREQGPTGLREDLVRLQLQSRTVSARWRQDRAEAGAEARALEATLRGLRRRHTAVLENAPTRAAADATFRAAEALIAAAEAWQRERAAAERLSTATDDGARRRAATDREESARLASGYRATAERLLARRVSIPEPTRTETASPGAGGTP